jgi:hypothetical protein
MTECRKGMRLSCRPLTARLPDAAKDGRRETPSAERGGGIRILKAAPAARFRPRGADARCFEGYSRRAGIFPGSMSAGTRTGTRQTLHSGVFLSYSPEQAPGDSGISKGCRPRPVQDPSIPQGRFCLGEILLEAIRQWQAGMGNFVAGNMKQLKDF